MGRSSRRGSAPVAGAPLPVTFFARPAAAVARELVGQTLVRLIDKKRIEVTIIAAEAFEGGVERRNARQGMLYAPGTIFVMSHRGHHYLNIATGAEGEASCVMIREVFSYGALVDGPGRIGNALEVKDLDGQLLGRELWIESAASPMPNEKLHLDSPADNSLGGYRVTEAAIHLLKAAS